MAVNITVGPASTMHYYLLVYFIHLRNHSLRKGDEHPTYCSCIRPVKTEWRDTSVVICLERGAHLHIVRMMPLPLTVCCFSKSQIGIIFLVSAHPGSPGQRAIKRVCACVTTDWPTHKNLQNHNTF